MMYTILAAEARAAGLPDPWTADILLSAQSEAAGRAAIADRREWLGIADVAAKRFPHHDLRAIARDYLEAGLPLAQFRADIISRLAEADEHVDTARPTSPEDRIPNEAGRGAFDQMVRAVWTARQQEQEAAK